MLIAGCCILFLCFDMVKYRVQWEEKELMFMIWAGRQAKPWSDSSRRESFSFGIQLPLAGNYLLVILLVT